MATLKNLKPDQIFVGNGSDEVIDLAVRIFCTPGTDFALTFTPTYGMYEVSAALNDVVLKKEQLTPDFEIDLNRLSAYLDHPLLKLIFICSPNNPTGNLIQADAITYILERFRGIVVVDEAYIDFSTSKSWLEKLDQYPNLLVSQTFSKAWGLAAARVGVAYGSPELIRLFNRVKPPYNVSALNQLAAIAALEAPVLFEENRSIILGERRRLEAVLPTLPQVVKVYSSDTNFLLVEMRDADKVYQQLVDYKIITRNRNSIIPNCIRITVGTPDENSSLLKILETI